MKGVVFTEFLEMVESTFGLETADSLLELPQLETGGAYTAVGTYDATELVAMVLELSRLERMPVPELLHAYGKHLFGRFVVLFPQMFEGVSGADEFLSRVDGHIHVEVRKLYPEAELPEFEAGATEEGFVLEYRSDRPFAHFAGGLIQGCLDHYQDGREVVHEALEPGDGTHARFVIR